MGRKEGRGGRQEVKRGTLKAEQAAFCPSDPSRRGEPVVASPTVPPQDCQPAPPPDVPDVFPCVGSSLKGGEEFKPAS